MLGIVLHTVPCVGCSYEHFSDGFELNLLPPGDIRIVRGDLRPHAVRQPQLGSMPGITPDPTRGNRKSQFPKF